MRIEHGIEPELMEPRPRSLRKRPRSLTSAMGCLRVFIIPFVLIGIGMALSSVGLTAFWLLHDTTTGRITGRETIADSESDSYYVGYVYHVDGQAYRKRDSVGQGAYGQSREGMMVPVAYLPAAPEAFAVVMPPGRNTVRQVGIMYLMAAFWNAIVFVFVYIAFIAPRIERRLYEQGEPAVGTITKRRSQSGEDSTSYLLDYQFAPTHLVEPVTGTATVTAQEWTAAQIGDTLTVLYDPARPRRSVAYRYGGYEVASPAIEGRILSRP